MKTYVVKHYFVEGDWAYRQDEIITPDMIESRAIPEARLDYLERFDFIAELQVVPDELIPETEE